MFSPPRKPLTKPPISHATTTTPAANKGNHDIYLCSCSSSTLSSASSSSLSPISTKRRSPPPSLPPCKKVVIEISDDDDEEEKEEELLPQPKRPRTAIAVPVPAPKAITAASHAAARARLDALFARLAAGSSSATAYRAMTEGETIALPVPTAHRPGALINQSWPMKGAITTTVTTVANTTGVGMSNTTTLNAVTAASRAEHAELLPPPAVNPTTESAVEGLVDLPRSANASPWVRPHTASRGLRAPLTSQLVAITSSPPFSVPAASSTPAPFAVGSARPAAAATPKAAVTQIVSSSPIVKVASSPPPASSTGMPPYAWIDKTGRSIQRLHAAIRRVLDEAGDEAVKRLVKELRHDWEVDEMAIFVEGYLRGALHERIL